MMRWVLGLALVLAIAFAYTWLGHAGRQALSGGDGLVRNVTIALSLLAAVALLPRLVRKLRAMPMLEVPDLKRKLDAGKDVARLEVRTASDVTRVDSTPAIPGDCGGAAPC